VLYLQSPSDFGGLGAVSATSDGPVYDVYTGPGSRNPDGDVHAVVVSDGIGGYDVNFEDELATYYIGSFGPYSSDFNYGDGQLVVSGVSVVNVTPGPAGALAFAAGAIGVRRRRRRTTR
jgi:MYXO-CTERM domain-containing protein